MEKRKAFRKSEPLPASQNSMDMGCGEQAGKEKVQKVAHSGCPRNSGGRANRENEQALHVGCSASHVGISTTHVGFFPSHVGFLMSHVAHVGWEQEGKSSFLSIGKEERERCLLRASLTGYKITVYILEKVLKEHVFLSENFGQRKEESQ